MLYHEFVELYEKLASTTKKLEKVEIIAEFLPKLKDNEDYSYLLRGKVFPDYDSRELGISTQLVIRSISLASGSDTEGVVLRFKKSGDLGDVAVDLLKKNKQSSLFSKKLTVRHVLNTLQKLTSITGDGSIEKKIAMVSELLIASEGREACYIVRTLLNDLRIGVADAVLLSAIAKAFFPGDKEMLDKIEKAYDLLNDFSTVLKYSFSGKKSFEHVSLIPGRPLNVMLATKVSSISEAFEVCGKPAAFEHKYDGFRVIVSYDGENVKLFTRRLEDVTSQFPDVVKVILNHVRANSFILDAEAVGFDSKKK